ncbi:MAG: PH domain-containing protein [Gemmataceae bacterium]
MNSAPDPAFVDQSWRGYDPRAAAPLLLLAAALTAALLASRFLFNEFLSAVLTYLLVLGLWPALLFVAAYRSVTYTYRLTDRALLVDRGFLHHPVPPLTYDGIAKVEHGASPVYSWLRVGWVRVSMNDGREVKLRSLRDPAAFAASLEERRSRKPPAA